MHNFKTVLYVLFFGATCVGCSDKTDVSSDATADEVSNESPYAAYAGDWMTEAYSTDGDELLVAILLTATDSPDGWSWIFTHIDEPVLANSVAMMGDSVVVQIGPFPSALREGVTVESVTSYLLVHGDSISGRFEAVYEGGDELSGRLTGERVK
ncbi:MAG: hypothetical protein IH853_10710 [Bacteroidetes bacterium]|nr:hypothetical protein [Bacteroidota bacterium]